jgi:protein TonB
VQPIEVPEEVPEGPESPEEGVEGGVEGGVPGGVEGGVPGGVLGGVPGGVLGGVLGGTGDQPIIVTGDMVPPKLIMSSKVRPEYPELARKARLEGKVFLQAVITKEGSVAEVTVLRSSSPLFDDVAIEAVKHWRYEPALSGGQPVAVYFTVIVEFRLE